MDKGSDLYIFTGFLGSGKTTVLHDLLAQMQPERVGVIVNEWGNLGVDRALIRSSGVENIFELVGGQIFCACLSGSFLNTLNSLLTLDVAAIFVETSGLAKPSTLRELVEEAEKRSNGLLEYRGMVCVIDAARFLKLRSVVKALDEQVVYSDYFILSKADLVDPETVQRIIQVLRELKPDAEIFIRAGKPIPFVSFFKIETHTKVAPEPYDPIWAGWGRGGRPVTMELVPKEPIGRKGLYRFLEKMAPHTFRIKGFVTIREDKGTVQIDGVEEEVHILPVEVGSIKPEEKGITFIWKGTAPSRDQVLEMWRSCTGTEGQ
jgi:G3E family GTPase